eukprot:7490721-Pyramimonas_sp.AAC.1
MKLAGRGAGGAMGASGKGARSWERRKRCEPERKASSGRAEIHIAPNSPHSAEAGGTPGM